MEQITKEIRVQDQKGKGSIDLDNDNIIKQEQSRSKAGAKQESFIIDQNKQGDLLFKINKSATNKIKRIKCTLFDEFSFNMKIGLNDDININGSDINTDLKKVNNVKIVVNSTQAKKNLKKVIGLDYDNMLKRIENEKDHEIRTHMKALLSNNLKKTAKEVLIFGSN